MVQLGGSSRDKVNGASEHSESPISNPNWFVSLLERLTHSNRIVAKVTSDETFLLHSEPIPIIAGEYYRATTTVKGLRGNKYSACFTIAMADAEGREVNHRIQWLNDFSHTDKQYSVTVKAPLNARYAVVGYRVNVEGTASECEYRFMQPERIKLQHIHDSNVTETPDWSIAPDEYEMDINGVRVLFHDPPIQIVGSPYWRDYFVGNPYEYSVIRYLGELAKQYDSVRFVDAGAHYGYFTLYMGKILETAGAVYSFEPNTNYFQTLTRNVLMNRLTNAHLYPIALSDRKGKAILETSQAYRKMGLTLENRRMRSLDSPEGPKEGSVDAISFDELNRTEKILPNIVKVDVHGAEGNVIHGMKESLKHSVDHLFCELHAEMSDGYTAQSIVNALVDAGMEVFEFHNFRSREGKFIQIPTDLFDSPNNRMLYARKPTTEPT